MSSSLAMAVRQAGNEITQSIKTQMQSRAVRVANEMRNAELEVLSGSGGGRRYRIPGTGRYYTASAPGAVPAVRTGAFRMSWQPDSYMSGNVAVSKLETSLTVNGYTLGSLLEDGTSKMAPRPHHEKILKQAEPRAIAIYEEPYI